MRRQNVLRAFRRLSSSSTSSFSGSSPKVAVVGSGPAGFYSAQYLLKNISNAEVHMFEKYPVPFGLVRFGVAPDHPEVKNVIHSFTNTVKTANFRFFGGVSVGSTVTVSELLTYYHAVILAYGASKDRYLGINGEDGPNVLSARDIVGWYNGLPDNRHLNPDLSSKDVVIVGQGNVAVDVARILLTPPEILAKTDITSYALETLRKSCVENVYLVGRRGPIQVAFTIKEFRELTKLPNVNLILAEKDVEDIKSRAAMFPKQRKRLMELLVKSAGAPVVESSKNLYLKFLMSPRKILRTDQRSIVLAVNFVENKLEEPTEMASRVVSTDGISTIKCQLVIRSIGYEAAPVCPSLPFDNVKHIIPNDCGRVESVKGLYCSGWIKRGPVGVILTTMNDAYETVDSLLEDNKAGLLNLEEKKPSTEQMLQLLRARDCLPVSFPEWENIDAEETRRGVLGGKPREKIVDVGEMISVGKGVNLRQLSANDDEAAASQKLR